MARVGSTIGSIRLRSVLGRGGMGEVYEGFDETLHRTVAVKSLRGDRTLDADAKARFLHEARVLSSLHHPNICLVHDFVEHEGDAYLVMEKVDGVRLDRAIDAGLDRRRRLDIAVQLADALAAAHARGIVHRDLKPDNVMLTADGVVKVLDFGIARLEGRKGSGQDTATVTAAAHGGGETTIIEPIDTVPTMPPTPAAPATPRTTAGSVVGTPAYMSPEQAAGSEVSPASDVYSLGLVLQYLFTGTPAHDPGLSAVELLVRARRGETRDVSGTSGDLAALIRRMKAVGPADRPTSPSVADRLRRIRSSPQRRLRWAAAAALVVVAVTAGAKYTFDLGRERAHALAAQADAEAARDEAEAVNEFLVSVLIAGNPGEARGEEVTVRQVLDTAAAELPGRDDLGDTTKVRYMMVVGHVYRNLGHFDQARSVLASAVELADAAAGGIEPAVDAQSRLELGRYAEQTGDLDEARRHFERAAAIVEQRMPDRPQARAVALGALGNLDHQDGDLEGAVGALTEALEILREVKEPGDPQIGMMLGNLAIVRTDQGDCPGAVEANGEALAIFEQALGADHPFVADLLFNMADCEERLGRLEEAHGHVSRSLEIRSQVFGPDHPTTAQSLTFLGSLEVARGRLQEAESLLDRAEELTVAAFGRDHSEYVHVQLCRLDLAIARGDLERAERLARGAFERARRLDGFNALARGAATDLVEVLLAAGAPGEAMIAAEESVGHRIERLGAGHELVGEGWVLVARARWAAGDVAGAREALEEAFRLGWTEPEIESARLAALAREIAGGAPAFGAAS